MNIRAPLLPTWIRWGFVTVIATFIFYVSIVGHPPETPVDQARPVPALIPIDKWRHFVAYAVLGGALAYASEHWEYKNTTLALFVIGITVFYGVCVEFGQSLVPQRYFSLGDAWANAIGGLLIAPWYLVRPYIRFVPVVSWIRE